jgi:uncharacterized Zn finger protein (UPF0148 family)
VTDNIVSLTRPDPRIWVCGCGCSTFMLREDGEAVCAHCETEVGEDGGAWLAKIAHADERDPEAAAPFEDVQGNGSPEFCRARMARVATDDDVTAIVVVKQDGRIHAWSEAETRAQLDWVTERLEQAKGLIGKALK